MSENVPRRMQRFYREKPTHQEAKEKSAQIAVREVDSFMHENNRYPSREELDKISENVFDQLKKELTKPQSTKRYEEGIDVGPQAPETNLAQDRRDRRRRRPGDEKEEAPSKGIPGEVETSRGSKKVKEEKVSTPPAEDLDIMSELKEGSEDSTEEGEGNVGELAQIDELSELGTELENDDLDNIDKEVETDMNSCPRCKSKTQELIFCPNCGNAFCAHCAKSVEALEDSVKYTCPQCSSEFRKRKPK